MTAFTEKLDRAAGAALCEVLRVGGQSLIGYGAVGLAAGGTGVVPIAAGSLALMAYAAGCEWDPQGEGPPVGPPIPICFEGASNFRLNQIKNGAFESGSDEFAKITDSSREPAGNPGTNEGLEIITFQAVKSGGAQTSFSAFVGEDDAGNEYTYEQVFVGDETCEVPSPSPDVEVPPYEYTDPEDGCKLVVNFKGFQVDQTGGASPVFKIEPGSDLRADGGIIGGCNFSPVIYTKPTDDPCGCPDVRPWDPGWDGGGGQPPGGTPPWLDFLNDLAGGVVSNIITNSVSDLFATPLPPAEYTLIAPCDKDPEGEPQEIKVQIPALPTADALATRIEALIPILQGQKDFKQPICPPVKAQGDLRTIGFISEEVSPNGKSRLRKRLRYRSQSGIGLDELIEHWASFSFDAGPVIVKHLDGSWGTVTCWASSTAEGKRVIRHAAAEAGIDVDQIGRWEVSSSTSTRLGMPGTMKVNQAGGYYWITARDGSNNRPLVGKT